MQILKITEDISVQLPNGPVGISFSGGADSSLLVYLAMSQLSTPIHLITTTVLDRDDSHEKTTTDVANKLLEITGFRDIHYHFNRQPDSMTGISTLFDLCKDLLYKDRVVNCILTGVTANPPKTVLEQFNNSTVEADEREANNNRSLRRGVGWYNPLTNLNKQDICKIYHHHNLLDSVFPLTKSCWTAYGEPPCNNCWFCEEREWGLKFNPHSD